MPFLDIGTVLTLRRRPPEPLSDAVICKLMQVKAARELRIPVMETIGFTTVRLMIEIRAQLGLPLNRPGLKKLRDSVRAYSVALATSGAFKDANEVEKQLQHHKLSAANIVGMCTVVLSR